MFNSPKNNSEELLKWFEVCLLDDERKWFAVEIFNKKKPLPKNLLKPFIKAAIDENNISLNRHFLRPCVLTFGELEVRRILNEYIVNGNDKEKAGAQEVIYWVNRF